MRSLCVHVEGEERRGLTYIKKTWIVKFSLIISINIYLFKIIKTSVPSLGLGSRLLVSFTRANTFGSSQPYMCRHHIRKWSHNMPRLPKIVLKRNIKGAASLVVARTKEGECALGCWPMNSLSTTMGSASLAGKRTPTRHSYWSAACKVRSVHPWSPLIGAEWG